MLIVDVIIDHHIVKGNNVSQVWLPNIPDLVSKSFFLFNLNLWLSSY